MRNRIKALVQAIQPYDPLEAQHLQEVLAWIRSDAPLCRIQKPDIPPRHLVSYFVVVDPIKQQLLLVDHRQAGLWLPSGGHVEPDEHPQATVVREALEELHLTAHFLVPEPIFLTITQTVGITAGHTDVSLWYVLIGNSQEPLEYDSVEFTQIAWFPLQALPLERCDPHLDRFSTKLLSLLIRNPLLKQHTHIFEA